MINKFKSLAGFLLLIILVQLLGSAATFSSVQSWYPALAKVAWNPPPWVFGPVWTGLYIMIAISGWRAWGAIGKGQWHHPAMRWYAAQLVFNLLWSVIFFGLRSPVGGLIDIVILLAAILATIRYFFPLDKVAAWLLVPYALWVGYALTLNAGIVYLNS